MSLRFICPHCRVAVDPAAMELSCGGSVEFRVCPCCDTPVALAARGGGDARQREMDVASRPSTREPERDGADHRRQSEAAT